MLGGRLRSCVGGYAPAAWACERGVNALMTSRVVMKLGLTRWFADSSLAGVFAACFLSVMIGLLGGMVGCVRGEPRDGVPSSMNVQSPEDQCADRRLVCIRLDVPALFREAGGRAVGCFGLVFQVADGFECCERSVRDLLADGKIEAAFRSVREARELIALRFARTGDKVNYLVVRHEHDAVWSVREEPLPEHDLIMGDPKIWAETQIGSADRGVGARVRVVGLPPPLGERGVAMVQHVTKGRSLHWVPPRDQNASLSTGWKELAAWIEGVNEVEDWVVVGEGELNREWTEFRRLVDARAKMPTVAP